MDLSLTKGSTSTPNQKLTENEVKLLKKRYENLLKEYRNKIVQLVENPIGVVNALNSQEVIDNNDLGDYRDYVRNFSLRMQQNEALFQIILSTDYEQLVRVQTAFKKTQNRRLFNVFDIIRVRLQASVNKEIELLPATVGTAIFADGGSGKRTAAAFIFPPGGEEYVQLLGKPIMDFSCLHRAAIEGDYKAVKDILKDNTYRHKTSWFTADLQTPIHFAAQGENSKDSLEFTKALIKEATAKGILKAPTADTETGDVVDGPEKFEMTIEELLNFQDKAKNTALHLAAEKESVQFAQYLCAKGANVVKKREDGVTPLDIMYDKTPEAVVQVLHGALAPQSLSQDGNLEVRFDFRAIIGTASDDPGEDGVPYNEMEVLAKMVFRNWRDSMRAVLPHIVVKVFLDLKWRKFRAPVFFFTVFYVLLHLWLTCFVIQVFIVTYPFKKAGAAVEVNSTLRSPESDLTFFGYLRGTWEHSSADVFIDSGRPLSPTLYWQGIGLIVAGAVLFIIELIECSFILQVATVTRTGNMQYRHIILSFVLVLAAVYDENIEAAIIGVLLLLIHVYDEISDRKGQVRFKKLSGKSFSPEPLLLVVITVALYLLAIFLPLLYYEAVFTGTVAGVGLFFLFLTFFGGQDYNSSDATDGSTPPKCTRAFISVVSILHALRLFFNRLSAYFANVENIIQLIFIALMIGVATVVFQTQIYTWYYLAAAVSVVLAWILILMQIGNIYGLGIYVQIFTTVLKRFLKVMSMYSVLLIAFSIAFSIIFPEEKLFTTLPASFFRVVSMMVGELNFDDIFNKEEGNEIVDRAFPYASHMLHTGFIVTVTIVLINLLIGLTVSDIEKIFEVSDVIHRSIQIERLYIMERLYLGMFQWMNRGNIFVIPPDKDREGQGLLELRIKIRELPKPLHKEIRTLAEDRNKYEENYDKNQ